MHGTTHGHGHAVSLRGATSASFPVGKKTRQRRRNGALRPDNPVLEMRRKHGLLGTAEGRPSKKPKDWSKEVLSGEISIPGLDLPPQADTSPKNRPFFELLKARYGVLGFDFKVGYDAKNGRRTSPWVQIINPPTIDGFHGTLADMILMDPVMVDGYTEAIATLPAADKIGKPAGPQVEAVRDRMNDSGVGYKGLSGVSWRQLIDPFTLPASFMDKLGDLGRALALGFKAIETLYPTDAALRRLLNHGRPNRIPELMLGTPVTIMRPDIVVVKDPKSGELRPVITELESAPGGQGMAHAMEAGYQVNETMVDGYVRMLGGRKLVIFFTNEWAEYIFDQATFVAALRARGVNAEIWFDAPLAHIHDQVQPQGKDYKTGTGWWPFPGMTTAAKAAWDTDFLGRLKALGFDAFIHGSDEGLPDVLGDDTVVFRFGYFDNFVNTKGLDQLQRWHSQGALVMNPLWHCLENKAMMAAFWLPSVMTWIRERDASALTVLHNCVAETRLIDRVLPSVQSDRNTWLTKYGAWDGNNESWGSRSLVVGGKAQNQRVWERHLTDMADKLHPVVAQHVIASARYSVAYRDRAGLVRVDRDARTRLTPFFLFVGDAEQGGTVDLVGSTMTLRSGTMRIHGADDAEEGPVIYRGE